MSRTFVAALAIGAVLGFGWAARAADETVATVGDKKITRAQLEDEEARLAQRERDILDQESALNGKLDQLLRQRADMVQRFLASRRTGFYFAVEREGEVAAGDAIERVARDGVGLSIALVTQLYVGEDDDRDALRRAAQAVALPASWRAHFRERLGPDG